MHTLPGFLTVLRGVAVLFALPLALLSQMYTQQTTYTDATVSSTSNSLHAWGYTYAPSGSSVVHTYKSRTTVTFPGGRSAQNTANGSGYTPATSDVWIGLLSGDPEGSIDVFTDHWAWCPFLIAGPFLSLRDWPPYDL